LSTASAKSWGQWAAYVIRIDGSVEDVSLVHNFEDGFHGGLEGWEKLVGLLDDFDRGEKLADVSDL
jgi:predicted heme/steroid binding protein